MRNLTLVTSLLVVLICLSSLPFSTVALLAKSWPNPSQLVTAHLHQKGSVFSGNIEKVSQAPSSVSNHETSSLPSISELLNIPGIPSIPGLPMIIPSIPMIPNIPGLPMIPNIPKIPTIPGLPMIPFIPKIPNIPTVPNIPGLPRVPGISGMSPQPPFKSVVSLQSVEMEMCLTKDESKTAEKCFQQISGSQAEKDFEVDKECCEIVVKMDKKCNNHFRLLFKSRFFVPLLQYSCHIKPTKN